MNKRGYSLLEVLAVLAIIAITFSIVTMRIQKSINNINIVSCENKMQLIVLAEKNYYTTQGQHSLEFISGEPVTETCQLVREGYLDWSSTGCDGTFQWSLNEDGDYEISCLDSDAKSILHQESEFDRVLFTVFPDDGETSGGTGDEPTGTPTSGDDHIVGTSGDDVIDGLNGDDEISGKDGNDTLYGNNGKDTIYGGDGDDDLSGGNQNDTIYGGDDNDYISGGNGKDDLYGDDGNDTIDGGNNNDYIRGGSGNDTIFGYNGKDEIYGDEGNDEIYGENQNDTIAGGIGDDTIYGGKGTDTVVLTYNYQEYTMTKYSDSHYVISHPTEGTDTLYDVEKLKFANITDKIDDIYDLIG